MLQKARAAIAWCESASSPAGRWEYLYIPQGVFERHTASTIAELANTCRPARQSLIETEVLEATLPPFAAAAVSEEKASQAVGLVSEETLSALPNRFRNSVDQAVMLLQFMENKEGMNFAPVFNALLGAIDDASRALIVRRLSESLPAAVQDQKAWFAPYLGQVEVGKRKHYENMAQNLKRTLVFGNGLSPIGLLRNCYDFALNDRGRIGGVFDAVIAAFSVEGGRKQLTAIEAVNDFRNSFVAHQEKPLTDAKVARRELRAWIELLAALSKQT